MSGPTMVTMTNTDIETAPSATVFEPFRGESWADLTATAVTVQGTDLEAGTALIAVPFVITAATFRVSDILRPDKTLGTYVSLEVITGDTAAFAKAIRRKRLEDPPPVDPDESLVFNEGGTGVYRQVVAMWESWGWITLPGKDKPEGGPFGESRFDAPIGDWSIRHPVTHHADVKDGTLSALSAPMRVFCPRGLRQSEYANEWTKEGRTRYIG